MTDIASFQREIRALLECEVPSALRGTHRPHDFGSLYWGGRNARPSPDQKRWLDIAVAHRLTAPTWPIAYGGGGLSEGHARVLHQEIARLKLPPPLVGLGLEMIGPTLLGFATEEQCAEHLPRIALGEARWCQGYSEPGAGSDLASLSTRAIRDGDHFVVNGQKVWTSYADKSDWIFTLVRTDPDAKKQSGISVLLIDMTSPGVSTRPIELISGASPFCETFFDDVRVPLGNLLGPLHGGWTLAKAMLGFERNMIGDSFTGLTAGGEESLVARARARADVASGPLPDDAARQAIARFAMRARSFADTVELVRQTSVAGKSPGPESSILKVVATELLQLRWQLAVHIAGPDGLGWDGEGFNDEDLEATRQWLRSRANTIEGGTSEVQLNVIAKRVLGLGA